MSMLTIFLITAGLLFVVGLFGIITRRNIIRILLAVNILQAGVNLLLIALGWRDGADAPILRAGRKVMSMVDPLPQALVLTAIVIGFGTTAVGLVLAVNYHRRRKTLDIESFSNEKHHGERDEVTP